MASEKALNEVNPELPSGTRDYLPAEYLPKQKMLDTIRATFELFGFSPIETSSLQNEDVLTGGDENSKKQIFNVINKDSDSSGSALRFDLTVPLARLVASSGDQIERPFKRYEIGKVWRGEKAQAGRYREFLQCDADIVGSNSPLADAEIISLIYETLKALGFENFQIKINSRESLSLLDPEQIRTLDKLDKIGEEKVRKDLENLGLATDVIENIFNNSYINEVKEIDEVISFAKNLGVADKFLKKDPTLARGLDYYTGIVYEAVLTDMPEVGTVFGGGRYDGLVERFGGPKTPAVGASIGIDRLFAALEKKDLIKGEDKLAKVLVLNFDESCTTECLKIVSDLRREKIGAEIYLGKEETLKGQLAFAVKNEYEFVVIVGQQEKEKGVAQIKNMIARTQEEVKFENISGVIKNNSKF
ncbi:MAG: histidine--tRNA ligase [Minisyncoccia bacterium]